MRRQQASDFAAGQSDPSRRVRIAQNDGARRRTIVLGLDPHRWIQRDCAQAMSNSPHQTG